MRTALFIVLVLMCSPAFGRTIAAFDGQNVKVLFDDSKCDNEKVIEVIRANKPESLPMFLRALVFWKGKKYGACYAQTPQGLLVIDESGDAGFVPQELLVPVIGA